MQYTITSRGSPIGVTDLGFPHVHERTRFGWFYPNAEGERLMPVIASVLPAMRAYVEHDVLGPDGTPIAQPGVAASTELADLAEALQRVHALDLALHREDGSLVPTEAIGIQDTEQLIALAELRDDEYDADAWLFGDARDEGIEDALDGARELDPDAVFEDGMMEDLDPWTPDDEPSSLPRYQVHVVLADPAAS